MTSAKPFKVLCCDPFTGHMMDAHGVVVAEGADPVATFDDADDAKKYARDLVARHPHVECHVIGPGGLGDHEAATGWLAASSNIAWGLTVKSRDPRATPRISKSISLLISAPISSTRASR